MRRWTFALIACLGCNRVFGIENTDLHLYEDATPGPDGDPRIDLDRDGIKDVEDPCIAPDTDLLINSDNDFIGMVPLLNGQDPCPFEDGSTLASGTSIDADGDGIGDACDPTPVTGDRLRCVMAFTDPDLDVAMWHARDDSTGWRLVYPRSLSLYGAGSITADWPFEGSAVTTYHVVGYVYIGPPGPTTRFDVFARAGLATSDADVGCSLIAGNPWRLAASGGDSVDVAISTTTGSKKLYLDMTVVPGAADGRTLRCRAHFDTGSVAEASTGVALPPGNLAFAAEGTAGVLGLTVYERDDAPP